MVKISAERASEISRNGNVIRGVDGKRFIPRGNRHSVNDPLPTPPAETEKKNDDSFHKEILTALVSLISVNTLNTEGIIKNNQAVSDAIAEMVRTKPKRKWSAAVVSRDNNGKLKSLDIEEM